MKRATTDPAVVCLVRQLKNRADQYEAWLYINLPRLRNEYMRGPPVDAMEWVQERFFVEKMS